MRYLVINDNATPEQIREGIRQLRARQLRAVIASTRAELADDIDELLEMLPRPSLPAAAGEGPTAEVSAMPG